VRNASEHYQKIETLRQMLGCKTNHKNFPTMSGL
jgi:hypothetical protein